jgi:signal transduction histidine kinase
MIEANPGQLKQVFLNCVLNAIDAMPEGGSLYVTTAVQSPETAEKEQPQVERIRVEFTDTGCGIAEEIQPRLFEPFLTTKEHGSGFGLSVSYHLIQAHQGTIALTSQPGEGTTVSIILPVRQDRQGEPT